MQERELVEKLQRGESEAFRALVEEFKHKIVNTCYRFVMNREDAEDVAQEVFIQVHRSVKNFKGDSSLSTWIYRIAVSKSLDFLKHQKRQKRNISLLFSLIPYLPTITSRLSPS